MTFKITANKQWRQLKYGNEVPKRILESDFDYLNNAEASDGFFKYRGIWYHVSEFMRATAKELAGWDGYHSDSAFSGVVIQLSPDGEEYRVGLYTS